MLKANPFVDWDGPLLSELDGIAWEEPKMDESQQHPFDKVFTILKKISHRAIIMLLNALYMIHMDLNGHVQFIDNKSVDSGYLEFFSDWIPKVDNRKFHVELEQDYNPEMACRMVKYELMEAASSTSPAVSGDKQSASIAEGLVIHWNKNSNLPDFYEYELAHYPQNITYTIPVVKLAEYSLRDLVNNNMILLAPLYPTQFRAKIEKLANSGELKANSDALIKEIFYDTIDAIDECCQKGQINKDDASILVSSTKYIYNNLYNKYIDMRRRKDMNYAEESWLAPKFVEAREAAEIAEKMADVAEKKADVAEKKADVAEKKADDAEKKADDAEKKADDAEKKADDAEKKIDAVIKELVDTKKELAELKKFLQDQINNVMSKVGVL
jgi:hypothetical protein